uniref:Putative secreted peptide n=1 Tax=Anopheles braziliensis TaxID=58242 RepID=A0A2M3ZU21_9DIPT
MRYSGMTTATLLFLLPLILLDSNSHCREINTASLLSVSGQHEGGRGCRAREGGGRSRIVACRTLDFAKFPQKHINQRQAR